MHTLRMVKCGVTVDLRMAKSQDDLGSTAARKKKKSFMSMKVIMAFKDNQGMRKVKKGEEKKSLGS